MTVDRRTKFDNIMRQPASGALIMRNGLSRRCQYPAFTFASGPTSGGGKRRVVTYIHKTGNIRHEFGPTWQYQRGHGSFAEPGQASVFMASRNERIPAADAAGALHYFSS